VSRLSKLKPVDAETIVKALAKIGFQPIRQHGSHLVMKHLDGRVTVVPMHRGEELGRGILRKIEKDVQVSREELMQILDSL
jgi:predicted RNA binding protein YcfA (HicA-like mRNA interferase family)